MHHHSKSPGESASKSDEHLKGRVAARPVRHPRAGVALLDALLAFTVVSMVVILGYVAASGSLSREARAAERYLLTEFARTMLIQYVVTYPDTPAEGVYRDTYAWRIVESPEFPDGLEGSGLDIHYRRVDVAAWRPATPSITAELSTLTARRGPQP